MPLLFVNTLGSSEMGRQKYPFIIYHSRVSGFFLSSSSRSWSSRSQTWSCNPCTPPTVAVPDSCWTRLWDFCPPPAESTWVKTSSWRVSHVTPHTNRCGSPSPTPCLRRSPPPKGSCSLPKASAPRSSQSTRGLFCPAETSAAACRTTIGWERGLLQDFQRPLPALSWPTTSFRETSGPPTPLLLNSPDGCTTGDGRWAVVMFLVSCTTVSVSYSIISIFSPLRCSKWSSPARPLHLATEHITWADVAARWCFWCIVSCQCFTV